MSHVSEGKVYVGELGSDPSQTELEDAFSRYGSIRNVWVARNPPGFAFVEFDDPRDARDAVRGLDGRFVCGRRVVVEMSNGGKGRSSSSRSSRGFGGRYARGWNPTDRCYECGEAGHYSYDCRARRRTFRRSRSRDRRRSRSRDRRSRSRSRDRRRSRSYSVERRRARTRSFTRSRSRDNSRERSKGRSRSDSNERRNKSD